MDANPGQKYRWFPSLRVAQADPDGRVIVSNDYGSSLFVVAPASLVRCSEALLATLVSDIDAVTWMMGDPTLGFASFEAWPLGTRLFDADHLEVVVTDEIWLRRSTGLGLSDTFANQVDEVLLGARTRVDLSLLRSERQRALDRRRVRRLTNPPTSPRLRALGWDYDIGDPFVPFDAEAPS